MSTKITTEFGHAVPPAPRHSVTVHMGSWANVEKYGANGRAVIATFKNAYPRMKPHRDIADLGQAVLNYIHAKDRDCYLFSSLQSARECVDYSTSPRRDNGVDKKALETREIEIRAFTAKDLLFAVTFRQDKANIVAGFWSTPGVGVSSRFAEINLKHLDQLREVSLPAKDAYRSSFSTSAHRMLQESIIRYLDRASLTPDVQPRPSPDDVYFYSTGMAGVYKPHSYLSRQYKGTTVLFGMAFMNTITAFEEFGSGYKFFGLGTDDDMRALEAFLSEESSQGRKVQAIWAEFPANPILVTPNLTRLRALATQYDTILAIDDTIGSFANIDILSQSDLIWTSITKSFNGYADVIAGSVVLNPASPKYKVLKPLFNKNYVPELYSADAEAIEHNSRDYLTRTTKLNQNALALVQYLCSQISNPDSAIVAVYHPSINPSGIHYREYIRPATSDFSPGYGCLFSIEFEDMPTTIAFYDNLNIHKGPHLGAPMSLCFAYTMCAYATRLEWAAGYGLRPTQLRISAGLEVTEVLLEDFRIAIEAASKVKAARENRDKSF